jgi:DNA-binding IclR family transcriptional regulator
MSDIIQSVDRALEILIFLQNEGKETSVTKIANDMGIYKSTVHRTLMTLEARGFVSRNPSTEKYWLGSRLFGLGKSVEDKLGLTELIRPYAKRLSQKYNEVVNISVLERNPGLPYRSLLVLKEMSDTQLLSVNPAVGSSIDCHCSSVGKSLLAFCEDVDLSVYRDAELAAYTEKTIASYPELLAEIEKVRKQGYAMDCDEQEIGLTCIGAPIFKRNGTALAAISLSGPTSRLLSGDVEEKIAAVRKTAAEISTNF